MISVTLQFSSIAEAAQALARMDAPQQFATAGLTSTYRLAVEAGRATVEQTPAGAVIAYHDRPDIGAPEAPPVPPTNPAAAAFGGAVAQAAPLVAPTASPASIAPTAGTAPTAAPGTVELDATGLPWDVRIHASTKTKTQAGAWTSKRNVDATLKAQVEADLRGQPGPVGAQAPAAPPVAPPVALPVAPPVALPAPAGTGEPKTFAGYMAEIGGVLAARPADGPAFLQAALQAAGLLHAGQLAGRPDLIPAVDAELRRLLG